MPYIKQEERDNLNECIMKLVERVRSSGQLNYAITKLCIGCLNKMNSINLYKINYANLSKIIGVLESVKLEFYRKVVSPYEDIKEEENGEIYFKNAIHEDKKDEIINRKFIYICHPFRGKTYDDIMRNIENACEYGKRYEGVGYISIIPHMLSLGIFGPYNDNEEDDKKVVDYDMNLLSKCDIMVVCGDKYSKGMKDEIRFCKINNIKIIYDKSNIEE